MDESDGPAAPASGAADADAIPTFEELAADPEIAALLDFEPVARKFKRPDGWTPELQRELIARIAATGGIQPACDQMGKFVTGARGLYKARGADSFRRSWDAALLLGWARNGPAPGPFYTGPIPGIGRSIRPAVPVGGTGEVEGEWEDDAGDLADALLKSLFGKFVHKVRQEREARLAGKIALADFYLRQVTFFEVAIELASSDLIAAFEGLRRGDHGLLEIAETDASRFIDALRRATWEEMDEPERPPVRDDLFEDHGDYRSEPLEYTEGGLAESHEQQKARFTARHRRDAEAQLRWEAESYADWERRQASTPARDGDGGAEGDEGED